MSAKNFMSYGDAEVVFTGFANVIKNKKDEYETITYAQWQAMTPQQRAAKDYYISDYPSSQLMAGNIGFDNTGTDMEADDVDEAIKELKSDLNNCGIYVADCTIENNTNQQSFDYPSGLNTSNAILVGAKLFSQYNNWIDTGYSQGYYYGDFMYKYNNNTSKFAYTPKTAGATTRILFYFRKIDS